MRRLLPIAEVVEDRAVRNWDESYFELGESYPWGQSERYRSAASDRGESIWD